MSLNIVKNGNVTRLHKVYKPTKLIISDATFDELVTGVFSGRRRINLDDTITSIGSYFLYKVTSPGLNKVVGDKVEEIKYLISEYCYFAPIAVSEHRQHSHYKYDDKTGDRRSRSF